MGYFDHKIEMTDRAKAHTLAMSRLYTKEISYSVENGKIYTAEDVRETTTFSNSPSIELQNLDTVSAVFKTREENQDKKICVLNFSSYKNPGGKFLEGSSAQEESICHESTLYNCLKQFDNTFYAPHRKRGATNRSLYENEAIYLPAVQFIYGGKSFAADVLTCAAPNWTAAEQYFHVDYKDNYEALESRIKFIKSIMEQEKVDIAILGAYGAGVFGQRPADVAKLFKETFNTTSISSIVYAIPRRLGVRNYDTFYTIFKGEDE